MTKEEQIDKELQEMAFNRWEEFKQLTGLDITNFIICNEKKKGKSLNQIAITARVTKSKVQRVCKVCP